MEENIIVKRDFKTFCFNFGEIELLLLKYKHENNIRKQGKQQNE